MVLKYSQSVGFAQACPFLSLYDPRLERYIALRSLYKPQGLLLFTWCNHCPYVQRIASKVNELAFHYKDQVAFVAVNLNDPKTYPQDGPEAMRQLADENNYQYDFLFDEYAILMQYLPVVCTPEFLLFDAKNCWYHGAFDDTGMDDMPTGSHIIKAIKGMMSNEVYHGQQAMGCSIKR